MNLLTVRQLASSKIIEGKYMISEVLLEPKVVILAPEDSEKALKVLTKAEKACLISNSVKSNILMKPPIEVAEMV